VAEIDQGVVANVKRVAQSGVIYLQSAAYPRDIQLDPQQLRCAGFNPRKVRQGNRMIVDVRVENCGNLKTSKIRSLNGKAARPPGPPSKR
jgi:hypothetical protein